VLSIVHYHSSLYQVDVPSDMWSPFHHNSFASPPPSIYTTPILRSSSAEQCIKTSHVRQAPRSHVDNNICKTKTQVHSESDLSKIVHYHQAIRSSCREMPVPTERKSPKRQERIKQGYRCVNSRRSKQKPNNPKGVFSLSCRPIPIVMNKNVSRSRTRHK
jgi:hypothetical protein